jgi:hypothetical protein
MYDDIKTYKIVKEFEICAFSQIQQIVYRNHLLQDCVAERSGTGNS